MFHPTLFDCAEAPAPVATTAGAGDGAAPGAWLLAQADATRLPLADRSVDLALGSPPYLDARDYGDAKLHRRSCEEWIEWMLTVTREALRVSRGLVLWVVAGVTRGNNYQPGPEGLLYRWWRQGGDCQCWRPAVWHRVGIPGSGGKQWLRADVEYVLAFKRPGWLPWADNTACGHPPKCGPGGEMSHRLSNGRRVNQWGPVGSSKGFGRRFHNGSATNTEDREDSRPSHVVQLAPFGNQQSSVGRRPDGTPKPPYFNGRGMMRVTSGTGPGGEQLPNRETPFPVLANPGNLIRVTTGGGKLGHPLAHVNEAPYPMKLVEFFIKSWCPLGGVVLDPFSGSGTTVHAATDCGRRGIGLDLRMSQCLLGRRRLLDPGMKARCAAAG